VLQVRQLLEFLCERKCRFIFEVTVVDHLRSRVLKLEAWAVTVAQ
jgi:hypothetical protein